MFIRTYKDPLINHFTLILIFFFALMSNKLQLRIYIKKQSAPSPLEPPPIPLKTSKILSQKR